MSDCWRGKSVLITGGTSGFGRRIAEAFGRAGARLVLFGLEPELGIRAEEELSALGIDVRSITCDVTCQDDVHRAMSEALALRQTIDVLVNAAGRTDRGWIAQTDPEALRRLFDLNLLGAVRFTQAALPKLLESKGHVVNIGSLAAKSASRWVGGYPITKFAMAAFSQQLRLEMAPEGLHVLLVCPGPIKRPDERLYPLKQAGIPDSALKPGAGVKVRKIDPDSLARKILRYCEKRRPELVVPWKARLLFAIEALWPALGDWLVLKNT